MLKKISHQIIFPNAQYTGGSWTNNTHLLDVSCFNKFCLFILIGFWTGTDKTIDITVSNKDRVTGQTREIDVWDQIVDSAVGNKIFKVYESVCFDQIDVFLELGGANISCDFQMNAILKT